jgi:hypothetical protein
MSAFARKIGPEEAFQDQVLEIAALYRWRAYHTYDSRHSVAGFPDLVLVRGPELIFAELKAQNGRISAAQQEWINDLFQVQAAVNHARSALVDEYTLAPLPSVEVHIWRPADFDAIHDRLRQPRPIRKVTHV